MDPAGQGTLTRHEPTPREWGLLRFEVIVLGFAFGVHRDFEWHGFRRFMKFGFWGFGLIGLGVSGHGCLAYNFQGVVGAYNGMDSFHVFATGCCTGKKVSQAKLGLEQL